MVEFAYLCLLSHSTVSTHDTTISRITIFTSRDHLILMIAVRIITSWISKTLLSFGAEEIEAGWLFCRISHVTIFAARDCSIFVIQVWIITSWVSKTLLSFGAEEIEAGWLFPCIWYRCVHFENKLPQRKTISQFLTVNFQLTKPVIRLCIL